MDSQVPPLCEQEPHSEDLWRAVLLHLVLWPLHPEVATYCLALSCI